ncbi:MAG: futalosine hydrolase [Bacteroidales bacterium]|nr:futalosine hydrolase [Bacteroidales bacterium]
MLLITAATTYEVEHLTKGLSIEQGVITPIKPGVSLLVTGVGAVPTAFYLTKILANEPNLSVVNIGVAGTYSKDIGLGSVVIVQRDTFADYGADDKGSFLSQFDLGLANPNTFPYQNGWMHWKHHDLFSVADKYQRVTGITLAKASGSETVIKQLMERFSPQIETMECASVFYVCLQLNVPFICIRSISNQVEPRNREQWNMPLAINNLCDAAEEIIDCYTQD